MKYLMLSVCLFFMACADKAQNLRDQLGVEEKIGFYSTKGNESFVEFQAVYRSSATSLAALPGPVTLEAEIRDMARYLFGPLNTRMLGGMQKPFQLQVLRNKAALKDGRVHVPFIYRGNWVIHHEGAEQLLMPLPFSVQDLKASGWINCTDQEHTEFTSLWYYWDPSRPDCRQIAGKDYQE